MDRFESSPKPIYNEFNKFLESKENEWGNNSSTTAMIINLADTLSQLSSKYRKLFTRLTMEKINEDGTAFINYPNVQAKYIGSVDELNNDIEQLINFDLLYFPINDSKKNASLCFRNLLTRSLVSYANTNNIALEKIFVDLDFSDF